MELKDDYLLKSDQINFIMKEDTRPYHQMFNDLAFQYEQRVLSLVEHQSTWSENMPLREFLYLGRVYEKILDNQAIYKSGILRVPASHLHVLYNGTQERPLETLQRLSRAFRDEAIKDAIESCIRDGILETFLRKHGSEVFNMLFTEVTDEDIMNIRVEEAVELAVEKAVAENTKRTKKEIVAAMLRKNIPVEEIHELTEVPMETILVIRDKAQA